MEMIRRIYCGGTTYEFGRHWPGAKKLEDDDPNQLTVGPMFFRLGTEEDVTDDEDKESAESWDVLPSHFEIWCVTRKLFVSFWGVVASDHLGGSFQVDREQVEEWMAREAITVRRIPYDKHDFSDSEMPAGEAFEEIKLRFEEIEGGQEIEAQEAAREAAAGNGQQQVAPTS